MIIQMYPITKNNLNKSQQIDHPMPLTLSPSTLNLYTECKRCFWLQFNKKIKRPAGIFPSLPSGMDSILKTHFDSYMEKGQLPPELKDLKAKLFDNKELLKVWRNNLKGIQWKDGNNTLRGAIDNLLIKDNKLIVLDFKTRGFPLKEDTKDHYQNQLNIYNLLLRKNGYKTEEYAYLLFYHPIKVNDTGEVIFHTDLVKMDISIEDAEKLFKDAIQTLKKDIPDKTEECQYCKWAENCK